MDKPLPLAPSAADRAAFKVQLEAMHSPAMREVCEMVGHEWVDVTPVSSKWRVLCDRCNARE